MPASTRFFMAPTAAVVRNGAEAADPVGQNLDEAVHDPGPRLGAETVSCLRSPSRSGPVGVGVGSAEWLRGLGGPRGARSPRLPAAGL